jgi:HemY protein
LHWGARYNDGYVLLVMPPYRTEISLNLFIVAFAALVIALYGVLRALALTFGLPQARPRISRTSAA